MSSILKYFQKKTVSHPATTLQLPPTNRTGLSSEEQSNVGLEINNASSINNKRKRVTYREEDKLKIAKYANECGTTNAVSRYKKEFPKLAESTIRGWLVKYRSQLKNTPQSALEHVTIGAKRGRPLLLSDDLDFKLRSFLTNLRTAGGTINRHVLYGVLMGLIKSDLSRYGQYLEFCVTNGWVQSLYTRMGYTRRMVTTSRPVITRALWLETRDRFLNEIAEAVATYNIPDQLIINVDQTPSKFVPTENVTMAEKNSQHVANKGGNDKRGMTLTLAETLDGTALPFQLIYQGKTARSLPATNFPEGFCLSYNEKHWSNEKETLRLINEVIHPYMQRTKTRLSLAENAKTLLIWDAFKAQLSKVVEERLKELNIISVMVPKNMTHLLQPLDLSTNGAVKKMEKPAFSEYFTSCITGEMLRDPGKDVTTIEVDLKLSTLKPRHGKLMKELYEWLLSEKGKSIILSGWKSSGITGTVRKARSGEMSSLDPYL